MKDYYTILGILPTAEVVVIRAAYRALAQQYHPDLFAGDKQEAHQRMAEINEAYSVLKDSSQRKEYDSERYRNNRDGDSYFTEGSQGTPPSSDPLAGAWDIAKSFYEDLQEIEKGLAEVSWRLAYCFRAYLLEEKDFENREAVAQNLEHQFFEFHYGKNPKIRNFARSLIRTGKHEVAAELSKAVSVLGDGADPGRILAKFQTPPRSGAYSNLLGQEMKDVMAIYGIVFDGIHYNYGSHSYVKLEDAVASARSQGEY